MEQSCYWECSEERTKRNSSIFILFWGESSYLFTIFLATVIPIFLFSKCHLSLDTLLWTNLTTLTKWTHLLTTNKLTKNLNATRRQHFNVNRLNSKMLTLKKTDAIDTQRYYRLRCSVPQPPKLYGPGGLPKLHKPGIPLRPIVTFCGSPTYQLSKYLTTMLQPLTDKSRCKLQSTESFIDAIKTVKIPDDYT